MTTIWDPASLVNGQLEYAILVLNQPILDMELFKKLWNQATFRIAVDGGGNRWHQVYMNDNHNTLNLPNIVTGDFDSIEPAILQFFKDKQVECVTTPDQNETDFTKALRVFHDRLATIGNCTNIITFCEPTGDFHQIMANIETLHLASKFLQPETHLYIFSSTNIIFLLKPGSNTIKPGGLNTKYVSLIPIGKPTRVKSMGLKWEVDGELAFGTLVSTSNELALTGQQGVENVLLETTEALVWSSVVEFSRVE